MGLHMRGQGVFLGGWVCDSSSRKALSKQKDLCNRLQLRSLPGGWFGRTGLSAYSDFGGVCWRFHARLYRRSSDVDVTFVHSSTQRLPPHFRCFSSAGYRPRRTACKPEHPREQAGPTWCSELFRPSWATLSTDTCRYPIGAACSPTVR